jgi:peptide methionine sulfoxide reductase MsrA
MCYVLNLALSSLELFHYKPFQKKRLALASRDAYSKALEAAGRNAISTEIEPAPEFYMGELDHQQYDAKPGDDGSDLLFKHLCKRLDTYLRVTDITNQMKKTLHEGFQYR